MSTRLSAESGKHPGNDQVDKIDRTLEFRALAEMVPALVFMTDANGLNIYTNAQFQRYCGADSRDLLGDGWLSILHSDDRERASELWRRSWALGEAYDVRYRFRRFDGEYRWHVVRGTPLKDHQGSVTRWIGACTDVDDIIRSVSGRVEAEGILQAMAKMPGICLYAKDADGQFRYASEATLAFLDADADQVLGKATGSLARSPDDAIAISANDRATMDAGCPCSFEEKWTDADGRVHVFQSVKTPMPIADGIGVLGVSIEVTDSLADRENLSREIALLRAQLDAVPVICWLADSRGHLLSVNEAWFASSSMPPIDPMFRDLIAIDCYDDFVQAWSHSMASREILDIEVDIRDVFAGGRRRARVTAFPCDTTAGLDRQTCWVGTIC